MPRKKRVSQLTNQRLLRGINPESARIRDEFLDYLYTTAHRKPETIRVYRNDINIALVWAVKHTQNAPFTEWKKRHIRELQDWMLHVNQNTVGRVNRVRSALSAMSEYILLEHGHEFRDFKNVIDDMEPVTSKPVKGTTVVSMAQVNHLLDYLTQCEQYERACFVALAVCSGRNNAELCRFRVEEFDDKNLIYDGLLYKSSEKVEANKASAEIGSKRVFRYTLAKQFKPYFDMWMRQREELGIESEWLFPHPNDPSVHIGPSTLNSWSGTFSRFLDTDFTMTTLRQLWPTALSRAGVRDNAISEMAKWSSIDIAPLKKDEVNAQYIVNFDNGEPDIPERDAIIEL